MERSRRRPEDVAELEHRTPAPRAPAPAEQILALQRGAGNQAVGRMLSRFYVDTGTGSPEWKSGEPGAEYEDTGKTHRWFIWDYPLYKERLPALQEDERLDAPVKKKRRGPRKKKPKAPEGVQAPEQQAEDVEDEVETPEEAVQVAPLEQQQDDDDGFTTKKSKGAARREARAAFTPEQVDEIVNRVDGHGGEPNDISEPFNQLFNILEAQNQLRPGALADAYVSNDDLGVGFSVEVRIPRLGNWVAHAHLDASGNVLDGENATHYKRAAQRYERGVSVSLSRRQVMALLPNAATCLAYARNQTRNRPQNRRVA